jgi:hypothetical protein
MFLPINTDMVSSLAFPIGNPVENTTKNTKVHHTLDLSLMVLIYLNLGKFAQIIIVNVSPVCGECQLEYLNIYV